jgi:general secretion pathway protein F
MPNFLYEGLDDSGRSVKGTILAESPKAASARVREMGCFPTEIRAAEERRATRRQPGPFSRIGRGDVTVMTRQLASLLQAGMPVVRALNVLIENTDNERLADVLRDVRDEVQAGGRLWETLQKQPRVFDELYVNMVRAGEASGELENVLDRLADFLERQQQQWAHIRSAMAYPILLISDGSTAVFVLITFLIPRFTQIFKDFGQTLPLPTQVLLTVSGCFRI